MNKLATINLTEQELSLLKELVAHHSNAKTVMAKINNAMTIVQNRKRHLVKLEDEYNITRRRDWMHPRLKTIQRQIEALKRLMFCDEHQLDGSRNVI